MWENVITQGLKGPSLQRLMAANMDPGVLRPFVGQDGKTYMTITNEHGKPQTVQIRTENALLPHEVWIQIDTAVQRAAQARLKAVADLRSRGLVYNIPNGMSVPVLMTQRATRQGTAKLAMDPIARADNDRPEYDTQLLPLPVLFADVMMTARDLAVSKRGSLPLDTAMFEDGARAVAEGAEQLVLGNHATYSKFTYGGGTIYGYLDFPERVTATVTAPTTGGWVPSTFVTQVLTMKQSLINVHKYGPYVLYLSSLWDQYLDRDYLSTTAGQTTTITLRQRLMLIDGISEIVELDYLTGYDVLLVQMESSSVRLVIGMDITTVQWEEQGGQALYWKVMAIMVPHLRADILDQTGICHGK